MLQMKLTLKDIDYEAVVKMAYRNKWRKRI